MISRTHVIKPTSSKVDGRHPQSRGWSLYGAPWLQPVAISGKSTGPRNRKNKLNPLPPAATGCLRHGKEGSTVRVRQRASQKASKWPFLLPRSRTRIARGSANLSPRSVPKHESGSKSWLEQTADGSQSTSVTGRGSIVRTSERIRDRPEMACSAPQA